MNDANQMITRYLLGEMSEAEATSLEQKYFTDEQFFNEIVDAENDLVDRFVRGQLAPDVRQRFETFYLAHPKRRARARFAAALAGKFDSLSPAVMPSALRAPWWARFTDSYQTPGLAWAFSLAIVLLIAGLVWFAFETRRLHQELARYGAEHAKQEQSQRDLQQQLASEQARAERLASELDRVQAQQATPNSSPTPSIAPLFATLMLNITGIRGAQTGPPATLVVPPGTSETRFQLHLRDNDYSAYSIVVQSADGKQILRRDDLRVSRKTNATLVTSASARLFSTGDYILTLKGTTSGGEVEDISKTLFRVVKQ